MKKIFSCCLVFILLACRGEKKSIPPIQASPKAQEIKYAKGFTLEKGTNGIYTITITSPWPNAESAFTYALVPRDKLAIVTLNKDAYDAIITVPVERVVVTSTTHIPALEALEADHHLIGFPDTQYISSEKTRKRIASGEIKELGSNESLNTEMVLALQPDLIVGFGVTGENKSYETLKRSNIPIVYNGDWTEETPLGKAEWVKFFAPFFQKEKAAEEIFNAIETSYNESKLLAKTATERPSVFSGALYKDVWYCPGGKSWAAQFFNDANAEYVWANTTETGSLNLSWEAILEQSQHDDFWIGPAQFTTYEDLKNASPHYSQFDAFQEKRVYTFAKTKGETGGLLYYELAPHRPDIVLKDLIHILHPTLLPEYQPFFFTPLD
ncbi:MAG: ABC transporter substrate-binding protein [Maribacter sp.]